jgi:phosphopantothenoylcysteine decarboxylase / phosphopantothenate---cysteine ligase
MLKGKKILLGVTGSIAAYKSALLVRLFIKAGAEVKVIMTNAAKDFITPLSLSVLSKNPVATESFNKDNGEWNNHVELALWADLFVIAPASANSIAKMAAGLCDNILLSCYLSARCPVFIAPAMDEDMYHHPSLKSNIKKLEEYGNHIIQATDGELASGLFGEGRMEEPEIIFQHLSAFLKKDLSLNGIKALVTAGPTYEAIDAVRYIGNRSSGRMGFAIAEELSKRGAQVTLISGPGEMKLNDESISRKNVESADEMYKACMDEFGEMNLIIMTAAVSDYKPESAVKEKIKKENQSLDISLVPTRDILKSMGESKRNDQVLVGFALESNDEIVNAKSKLKNKNLDMIVLNSLRDEGAGFNVSTNKITIIDKKGESVSYPLKSKSEVASDVVDSVEKTLNINRK